MRLHDTTLMIFISWSKFKGKLLIHDLKKDVGVLVCYGFTFNKDGHILSCNALLGYIGTCGLYTSSTRKYRK